MPRSWWAESLTPAPPAAIFNGLISDVRVYNNALSAVDVESIYQQVLSGQAVPEPSSLCLIGLAMAFSLGYGRILMNRC